MKKLLDCKDVTDTGQRTRTQTQIHTQSLVRFAYRHLEGLTKRCCERNVANDYSYCIVMAERPLFMKKMLEYILKWVTAASLYTHYN